MIHWEEKMDKRVIFQIWANIWTYFNEKEALQTKIYIKSIITSLK